MSLSTNVQSKQRYNDLGQLTCIVCKIVIKTDSLWPDHIGSTAHKKNVEVLKQTQRDRKRQREKEEGGGAQKRQKVAEPTQEPEAAPFAQPEQKETINYVEDDIPADFFDDAQEQAKVVAMSTAQKVTERGDYVSVAEREEEERALRDLVLELDKKNEEEQDSKSEDDEDEVVGVVDLQYEPIYEPLSIVPQTAIREVGKPATSITEATSATLTTSDSAVVSEMALESEFERYQRELEDRAKEKVKALEKLQTLKNVASEKPKRTLPGAVSTLKRKKRQGKLLLEEMEEEDEDVESWRAKGFG